MNGAKIYVGNLSWNTNDDTLRNVFSQYGNVLDVRRSSDPADHILTHIFVEYRHARPRDRSFPRIRLCDLATQDEATGAIATANGIDLDGRQIKVNLANARGSGGAGGPGGPGAMYPPQPGFGAPYGGAGFGGYQPPQGNAGFGGFNQGPAGYGAPPNQFPPNQGGYPGQY
ncbi:RNA recognition motif protein [Rhizoctonia solani]|uniref:RNA recognition motif protein n=1 Tax=Rhizoctonia solani TaxID=456999 RepID=A0A8H8P277_9AGAM|nr:RNA recognition motif protein [Rhizoctonia solani]QRW24169.1 RNA recognition motif protein [Rhizoctonia solani]